MPLPVSWVNAIPAAAISVSDRGFRYGDSLFETLRYAAGHFHFAEAHLQRMRRGCEVLDLDWEPRRLQDQLDQAGDYLAREGIAEAFARLTLTRGNGARGYGGDTVASNLILELSAASIPWRTSLPPADVICCDITLADQPRLAGIKHGNRLEQVLAARELERAGADEGLMLDSRGDVVCAVAANLFALFGNNLLTPPVTRCGITGTVRQLVIDDLGPACGLQVQEQRLSLADLQQAEELMLTGSLAGIRSVANCPGRRFTSRHWGDTLQSCFFTRSEQATA